MAGVRITQQTPPALPGQPYGSFAGKTVVPHPVGRLTQLGCWGVSLALYGSFAGKPETEAITSVQKPLWRGSVRRR